MRASKLLGIRCWGKRLAITAVVITAVPLLPEPASAQNIGAIIGALGGFGGQFRGGGRGGGRSWRHERHHSSRSSRHEVAASNGQSEEVTRAPVKSSGNGPDFAPSR
jgi:hypothetical protein